MFFSLLACPRGSEPGRTRARRSPAGMFCWLIFSTGLVCVPAPLVLIVSAQSTLAPPDAAVARLPELRRANLGDAAVAFAAGEPGLGSELIKDMVAAERAAGLTADRAARRELALLATVAVQLTNEDRHTAARLAAHEAVKRAQTLMAEAGSSHEQRAVAAAMAGELAEWIFGDPQIAHQWYERALRELPDHPVARAGVARWEARVAAERVKAEENALLHQREQETALVVGPVPPPVKSQVAPERSHPGPGAMVPPVIEGRK
jgi:hypothetical protein